MRIKNPKHGCIPQINILLHDHINCGNVSKIISTPRQPRLYLITLAASCKENDVVEIQQVLKNAGFIVSTHVKPRGFTHSTLKPYIRNSAVRRIHFGQNKSAVVILARVNAPHLPGVVQPLPPPGGIKPGNEPPPEANKDRKKNRKRRR